VESGKWKVENYATVAFSIPHSLLSILDVKDLHISVDGTEIVKGIDLVIEEGQIHAIMGPNGSGKSTLVSTLMGHPGYEITAGSVEFLGKDLLMLEPYERAQAGLFLAFQYPKEIAGVTLRSFLFAAYKAQMKARHPDMKVSSPIKFKALLEEKMNALKMDTSFAERFVNKGFSGGEKKKAEVLQMHVLQPHLALLDETDSGLDVDALKIVADGVNSMKQRSDFSALVVTHYARILDHIQPDHVHVMVDGAIVESGGKEFAQQLEEGGYEKYLGV